MSGVTLCRSLKTDAAALGIVTRAIASHFIKHDPRNRDTLRPSAIAIAYLHRRKSDSIKARRKRSPSRSRRGGIPSDPSRQMQGPEARAQRSSAAPTRPKAGAVSRQTIEDAQPSSAVFSQCAQSGVRFRAATSSHLATSSGDSTSFQRPLVPLLMKFAPPLDARRVNDTDKLRKDAARMAPQW